MIYLYYVYLKSYYVFWNFILPKTSLIIPDDLKKTKNIFVYFDYEREFGGHNTSITDEDIDYIITLLKELSVKSTWFTVGKVFNKYPETINAILKYDHEIGSHTYNHISPFETSAKILKNDFIAFSKKTKNVIKIRGFHSPRGRWSFKMLKYLKHHDYFYDVVGARKNELFNPYMIGRGKNQFQRLHTIGDDWPLYNMNYKEEEVLNYFIRKINKINPGEVAGIGFHPWILFSDRNILNGFEKFINYLKMKKDIRLETAYFYAKSIELKH